MVVAMIESQAGLDAVDAIASVDGVDVVLVGANDLSVALGVAGHMDSPQVHDAYVRVIEACRAKGRRWGSADWAGAQTSSVATWSRRPLRLHRQRHLLPRRCGRAEASAVRLMDTRLRRKHP